MKKNTRILSLILSGVMLASSAAFTANAGEGNPQYDINFVYDVDAGKASATISIEGGTFGLGRFGFSYNESALVLLNKDGNVFDATTDFVADAVVGVAADDYSIVATEETNLTEDLIKTDSGDILFAWYSEIKYDDATGKDIGYVVAEDKMKAIATVEFKLSDDILNADNPTEALNAVEDLISVYTGDSSDLDGWEDVYVAAHDPSDKSTSDNTDITVDAYKTTVDAKASGTNVTVTWKPVSNEEEANIVKYSVQVYDSEGKLIAETDVEAKEENLNASKKYVAKFSSADGLEKNKTYTFRVTPVTELGNKGLYSEDTAKTTVQNVSTGDGVITGGSDLTYTVTYSAGEGTIPEGQKFKYYVQRYGYVAGSPAVVAPEGKAFAGWSVDGKTLVSIEVYRITKDTVFKALYVDDIKESHSPFILGYPGSIVKADAPLTRAEAAAIIARASGKYDYDKKYTANFSDVENDHWAYNYIAFVYENNIVTGYEDGSFHPTSPITRAEFATIMQRYLGIPLNEDAAFSDVAKDHWAVAYIGACKDAGLINGYENGEFRPSNQITRAESVKILNRAADRAPNSKAIDEYLAENAIPFDDLDKSAWYFYEIMEAAFPHLVSYYH